MLKTIEHNFRTKCHNLVGLFEGVHTLSGFMRRLEVQSQMDILRYDSQKYLGDGFEFFIELFLAFHPCDNRVGVYEYSPIQENDNGVDGVGKNIRGDKCVIQVKYRSNNQTLLTANEDHLSNLFSDGMLAHGVVADMNNKKNFKHFVFTTAEGLHFYTDGEMFKGKVKCFGYNEIRGMVDNNMPFWDSIRSYVNSL